MKKCNLDEMRKQLICIGECQLEHMIKKCHGGIEAEKANPHFEEMVKLFHRIKSLEVVVPEK